MLYSVCNRDSSNTNYLWHTVVYPIIHPKIKKQIYTKWTTKNKQIKKKKKKQEPYRKQKQENTHTHTQNKQTKTKATKYCRLSKNIEYIRCFPSHLYILVATWPLLENTTIFARFRFDVKMSHTDRYCTSMTQDSSFLIVHFQRNSLILKWVVFSALFAQISYPTCSLLHAEFLFININFTRWWW